MQTFNNFRKDFNRNSGVRAISEGGAFGH